MALQTSPAALAPAFKRREVLPPTADFRLNYGVHNFTLGGVELIGNSAPNWDQFRSQLLEIDGHKGIVASSELITVMDLPWEDHRTVRHISTLRIGEVVLHSLDNPQATYVIGTPVYDFGQERPTNSVLVIRNGKRIARADKRILTCPEEIAFFRSKIDAPPVFIPDTNTGLLICVELYAAGSFGASGKAMYIDPRMQEILMLCCWGIGAGRKLEDQAEINDYYRAAMQASAHNVMR